MAPSLLALTLIHLFICNQVFLSLAVQQSSVFNPTASSTPSPSSSSSHPPPPPLLVPVQSLDRHNVTSNNTLNVSSSPPVSLKTTTAPVPQVLIINITSVLLVWDYPPTDPPTQFLVQCLSQDFNETNHNVSGLLNSTSFVYTRMRVASFYAFRIILYQGGVPSSSPGQQTVIFENGGTAPTGPPINLDVIKFTTTSVEIVWDPPVPNVDRVYTYQLYRGSSPNDLSMVDAVTNKVRYSFTGLSPNVLYYFAVQADIGGIKSILSNVINQTTKPVDLPPLVINVTPSITTANISWSRSSSSQFDSLKYYVAYYAVEALLSSTRLPNDTKGFQSKNFSKDSTSGTVSGLEEGVVYVFLVSYYADNTMSRISSPVIVQTLSSINCQSCEGLSKSQLEIKWTFNSNGFPVNFSLSSNSCPNSIIMTPNSSVSLIIHDITPWTQCNYSVMSETSYNYYSEPSVCPTQECATLQDKPSGFPLQFRGNPLSSRSVLFHWDPVPEEQRNGPITSYVISSLDVKGGTQRLVDVQSSPYNLSRLSPYTEYKFFITASNSIGFGPSSPGIIIKTLPDVPTGPPLNITLVSATNTSLSLSWSPPLEQLRNGPIASYSISYYSNTTHNTVNVVSKGTSVTLFNLLPSSGYIIRVQASTDIGDGPWSSPFAFRTLSYTLPLPQILYFSVSKASYNPFSSCYAYKVSWALNNTSSGRILSQTLSFSSGSGADGSIDLDGSSNSHVLGSDVLSDSRSNYTLVLDVEYELQNKTAYNVTQSSFLITPSCNSSVITVVFVAGVVLFLILLLLPLSLCICCIYRIRRSRRLSNGPYAISLSNVLESQQPSVPNEYITSIRRADGQSDDGHGDNSSSLISLSYHDDLSNTPSDQNESTSQEEEEDAPLLSPARVEEREPEQRRILPQSMVFRHDDYVVPMGADDLSVVSDYTMSRRHVPDGSSFSSLSDDEESVTSAPEGF
ncbi:PREDICTED: protein sidekick-2-like [Amphimedon queenslandica]|uniref:Fibronectin type-III domain-containing protein n=1 Tax=Amphimedon queenslandica TaxID=400682 RepID=A0A1X7VDE9_AMPQE|nr:PREDICTED: protein sidekick-2-like [Amphimedon queenslandica]|eukprot:XP_019849305.1 PREDICTED: protein sidekick-2-like [Amphimedon queenslandica]